MDIQKIAAVEERTRLDAVALAHLEKTFRREQEKIATEFVQLKERVQIAKERMHMLESVFLALVKRMQGTVAQPDLDVVERKVMRWHPNELIQCEQFERILSKTI